MNKVVAILGIIVLITLAGLFFCAGFFTGSNISSIQSIPSSDAKPDAEKKITMNEINAVVDAKSRTVSEKIKEILASSNGNTATATADKKDKSKSKNPEPDESSQITIDSLLREIAASHMEEGDDCSPHKTMEEINSRKPISSNNLLGKKIVFIGYFKNKIALQIQQLLIGKGYKAHVEASKTGDENESFVFCGPFKKEQNAKTLVKWLQKHNFSEARIISISKEAIEETLYDFINEDSGLPENAEKNIQEIAGETTEETVETTTEEQEQPATVATAAASPPAAAVQPAQ
jgi:cell division septation protein DedD